jgi:hypothetical protein
MGETSESICKRVQAVRNIQQQRFASSHWISQHIGG